MKLNKGKVVEIYLERNYTGQFGQIFVFMVEFNNGDKGEYHSKSNVPGKFIVGQEASYSIEETEHNGQKGFKIKPYDPDAANKRTFKSNHMEDPKKQQRIVRSVAIDCAIKYALYTKTTEKAVLNNAILAFEAWMLDGSPTTDLSITRQGILKNAIQAIQLEFLEIKTIEEVIAKANGFMGFVTKE